MQSIWLFAIALLILCCTTAVAVPVDIENSSHKGKQVSKTHHGTKRTSEDTRNPYVNEKFDHRPTKQTKTLSSSNLHQATSYETDDTLESLLKETESTGTSHLGQISGPLESRAEFMKWMESQSFENHSGQDSDYLSTHFTDVPSVSSSHHSIDLQPTDHQATASPGTLSSSTTSKSKRKKGVKQVKSPNWHNQYDEIQQKRLRDYYNDVLKDYGFITGERGSSLRNRMIRNTPMIMRDRIANGIVVRNQTNIPPVIPADRRARWNRDLSDEDEEKLIQFGNRLMSHREAKSAAVRNWLLASLTPEEFKAVKDGDEAEMTRIEAAKMPKYGTQPKKNV